MMHKGKVSAALVAAAVMLAASWGAAHAQPNPYRLVESWAQLPASMNGGKWGEVIAVKPDPAGNI
jgi:hypothetical protein